MRFELAHTHAYRGCRVRTDSAGSRAGEGDAVIEFSDGNVLAGRYAVEGDEAVLAIPAHRTARGTPVAAKRWRLRRGDHDGWKIVERLPDGGGGKARAEA